MISFFHNMNINQEYNSFCPKDEKEWREWLEKNHKSKDSIWLVVYKKNSGKANISWSQAVDQALCFGWIDGTKKSIDEEKYRQYFCKRKPHSIWSKINKNKIIALKENGLMREAGLKSIEVAKSNGSWTILDSVEELIVPQDLKLEFDKMPGWVEFYNSLSKSLKKGVLAWVAMAKRPATRTKRILEIVENAVENRMPKHFG